MKPSTLSPVTKAPGTITPTTAHKRDSSPDTTTIKTISIDANTSAIYITVETTNARVTFDGTDPSAASAPSTVIPKDQAPLYVPVGANATIKFVSTAAAASVVQVLELS